MAHRLDKYRPVLPLLQKTAADSQRWALGDLARTPATTVAFVNAHAINIAVANHPFREFLLASDYLLRDGIGAQIALKFFGLGKTKNLNGSDLIAPIISQYKDRRLAIFGASDAALDACRSRLEGEGFTQIVSTLNGFLDDVAYLKACAETRPEVILVCMGMPRQELLAAKLVKAGHGNLIICGGGWADFYSGTKPRAPVWVRRLSLEWVYRLYREPKRLGRRYTIDISRFFGAILCARLSVRK